MKRSGKLFALLLALALVLTLLPAGVLAASGAANTPAGNPEIVDGILDVGWYYLSEWCDITGAVNFSFDLPESGVIDLNAALAAENAPSGTYHVTVFGWNEMVDEGEEYHTLFEGDYAYTRQISFNLRIDGIEVNSGNMNDILGNGVFTFDGDHTLTIHGSYTPEDTGSRPIIDNYGCEGLVIYTETGPTELICDNEPVIRLSKDTTFSGKALTVWNEMAFGRTVVVDSGVTVTVKDGFLNASSALMWSELGTLSGPIISGGHWVIDNAYLDSSSYMDRAHPFLFESLTLIGCYIHTPEGGRISDDGTHIVDADGNLSGMVGIRPGEAPPPVPAPVEYGLSVNGVTVTSECLTDSGTDPTWRFDEDHTLTILRDIQGFTEYSDELGLWGPDVIVNYGLEGLVIDFVNHAKLTPSGRAFTTMPCAIAAKKDTVITGAGGGECVSAWSAAISVSPGAALTVRDTELLVTCENGDAIFGNSGTPKAKLVVDHARLDLTADAGRSAVTGFGGIDLVGCKIVEPEGGKISDDGGSIVNADGSPASHVVIEPYANPFTDVPKGRFYYEPVLWAFHHNPQITNGTDDTHFSPNKDCTREQVVTFLWKAAGAPEPETKENPFTDVKEGRFYYKAVLWAVENKITNGVSTDQFGVGQPCKREQAVTFLWKCAGSPEPETTENPFTDVKEGRFYYKAVLWAVENGITNGVSANQFGVGRTCTRGQIVTFLYNYMGK